MRRFLVVAALAIALAPAAQARLVREHVNGMKRQCFYRAPHGPLTSQENLRLTEVGFGESCPPQYRAPPAPIRRREVIPGGATLAGSRRENGQNVCIYRTGTREYRRPLPIGRSCPYTPY
jgi:hypothetical protein